MSQADQMTYSGEVTDIFAHRLVIKTATGKILADLGPKGAELVALREGDHIEVSGEMKPSDHAGRVTVMIFAKHFRDIAAATGRRDRWRSM
jgi:hypothetical protein